MSAKSAIYVGSVMHRRLRPLEHYLRYRIFNLLLDLDELPVLAQRLRCFSVNRFNLLGFYERDHGAGSATGLARWVRSQLVAAGIVADGSILLLALPRVLGYVFNPLSVYFCYAAGGELRAILYEVNNTFGERHCYLIEVAPAGHAGPWVRQRCPKELHVSPFLSLDLEYGFRVAPPRPGGERLVLGIDARDSSGLVLVARFAAQRRRLDDVQLLRAFIGHPLLTLKIIGAIHWEALRLWLKGARIVHKPDRAPAPVTFIAPAVATAQTGSPDHGSPLPRPAWERGRGRGRTPCQ